MKITYGITLDEFRTLQPPLHRRCSGADAWPGANRSLLAAYRPHPLPHARDAGGRWESLTLSCDCGLVAKPWAELTGFTETQSFLIPLTRTDSFPIPRSAFATEGDLDGISPLDPGEIAYRPAVQRLPHRIRAYPGGLLARQAAARAQRRRLAPDGEAGDSRPPRLFTSSRRRWWERARDKRPRGSRPWRWAASRSFWRSRCGRSSVTTGRSASTSARRDSTWWTRLRKAGAAGTSWPAIWRAGISIFCI